jgi:hypothetical protein
MTAIFSRSAISILLPVSNIHFLKEIHVQLETKTLFFENISDPTE